MMRLLFILFTLLIVSNSFAQRIVSLVPSVTQTLQQLGADSKVVARTSMCPTAQNGKTVVVGDVLTVNVEQIVAMSPTAIITMGFTRPEVIKKLKHLKLNVVELQTPSTFEEMCEQTLLLGKLADCEQDARHYISEQKKKLQEFENHKNKGYKYFFQVGTKPLWGASPKMYLTDLIQKIGGTNIVNFGNGSVSREYVVASNPNVIVMTTMGGLWKEEKEVWRKLCKNAIVIVVDEDVAGCPTPQNFCTTIEKIFVNDEYNKLINR